MFDFIFHFIFTNFSIASKHSNDTSFLCGFDKLTKDKPIPAMLSVDVYYYVGTAGRQRLQFPFVN